MPTYAYRCTACGHEFDQFQKMSDDPLTVCPECGGEIRRVIHPVGVVFKGSGWYITDSRKKDAERKAGKANGDSKAKEKDGKQPAKSGSDAKADSTKSEKAAKAAAD